jgi:DNA-directed RNA polymerase subunit RPC12/RpoP
MRLLFTTSGKTKVVRGGESFVDDCPECGHRATFDEVEITRGYGVFFVDVLTDTERAFRCGRCGETFERQDTPDAPKPDTKPKPVAPPRPAVDVARAREAKATRIEDELAELKKRMGR